jgi:hypothetical protein
MIRPEGLTFRHPEVGCRSFPGRRERQLGQADLMKGKGKIPHPGLSAFAEGCQAVGPASLPTAAQWTILVMHPR